MSIRPATTRRKMMPPLNWHDLDSFEPGAFYQQVESGKTVQFVGVALMPEVDGGDVGVFRFVEGGRCLIATKGRYEQGQTFTPIAEYQEPDEATAAEYLLAVPPEQQRRLIHTCSTRCPSEARA